MVNDVVIMLYLCVYVCIISGETKQRRFRATEILTFQFHYSFANVTTRQIFE